MAKALDFLASDDEAPVKSSRGRGAYTNTDDSDNDVDITSSLIPSTSSATTSKAPGKNDKSKARNENSTPLGQRGTHPSIDSDDDAAFIAAAMDVQNKKAGNEIAKKTAKGKGKQKIASGTISGGGSFQSMGESI